MIRNLQDLNKINTDELINRNPISIGEDDTVLSMLKLIKKCHFPIMYLPVLKKDGESVGIVNFTNLIKAEI